MTLKMSGRSDLASFERLWVLSIRGQRAPDAPELLVDAPREIGVEERARDASTPLLDALAGVHRAGAEGSDQSLRAVTDFQVGLLSRPAQFVECLPTPLEQ